MEKRDNIDWDTYYGKAFRLTKAPVEGKLSIVTPENGDAWTDWEEANQESTEFFKKHWETLQDSLADYKYSQIKNHM